MKAKNYVIGIDYGTDSVRSLIVDTANGEEIATAVYGYPRWKEGKYCVPSKNQFRQHPLDYIEGLEQTVRESIANAPSGTADHIVALSIDTTGSTPVIVNQSGTPLAMEKGFENNPNAMFVLWKDHTAVKEAEEINDLAHSWGGPDYTKYEGGIYSSEWFWAKLLHVLRQDEQVRDNAFSFVEHCDWMPALLTGNTDPLKLKRSRCAAGHKAMWHTEWDGLPSEDFLTRLDPLLKDYRKKLYKDTFTIDQKAGTLNSLWASRLGLNENVMVGTGAFDAHLGAVGGEIKPYHLSKVMGTSTCDMIIAPSEDMKGKLVKGICGQVDGSVIPNMLGMEAGQSAFGDIYAWFKDILMWPAQNILKASNHANNQTINNLIGELEKNLIPELSKAAEKIPVETSGIVAIDWMNGRRTPDANQALKGAITDLTLGSDAPRIFRALVEATAFGAKAINERFIEEGVRIDGVIALGGVAKKSPFVMQTVSDVLNVPIKVTRSEQTCALGAAMAAAVAGGIHPSVEKAQHAMGKGFEKEYLPKKENAKKYETLFEQYKNTGNFIESQR